MPTILRGSDNFDTGTDFYADSDALTLFNAGGSAPVYACRAWVNFNGVNTVAIILVLITTAAIMQMLNT